MKIKSIRDSNVLEMNQRADMFINACGYEERACSLARQLGDSVKHRHSLAFSEWPQALSRGENEKFLSSAGFELNTLGGSDSSEVTNIITELIEEVDPRAIAIDISSMTRAWHGGVIRTLRSLERTTDLETFFAYTPAKFSRPPIKNAANEVVAPVEGFASLVTPDLPVALIVGLGYEKDRALGLQQLLDPKKTLIMVPRFRTREDLFHDAVVKANRDILESTHRSAQFDYWIDEPSATFGELASIIAGLTTDYRVVIASLGPKIFGLVCFLLATRFPEVSVWRVSNGVHGQPRQSFPDVKHSLMLSVTWSPDL
jgi:hypothetical protein